MFAHLAPGVSLADELVADRRAEVHSEEQEDETEGSTQVRDARTADHADGRP